MNYFPYLPLTTLSEFIEKLKTVGVEKVKVEVPLAENQTTTIFCLRRSYKGKDYLAVIHPSLRDDTHLSVDIIDTIDLPPFLEPH